MEYEDDPSIAGGVVLYRRIPPSDERVTWDATTAEPIPSSQNFRDKEDRLSVFIANETTPELVLAGHSGYGLVQFTAGEARRVLGASFVFRRDPSNDAGPGHVEICGKITGGLSKQLKTVSKWVPGQWPKRIEKPAS